MMPWFIVRRLELHARNFLIRADNLVSDLHHQLEGDVRLFHGDHDVVHITAIAFQQIGDLLLARFRGVLPPG